MADSGLFEKARWQRALAYALTGERRDDLPEPGRPDAAAALRALGISAVLAVAEQREGEKQPWPYPLPEDLRHGLGAAQWATALTQARGLVAEARARTAGRVLRDRPSDADDLRLGRDRPPHWG